MILTYFKLLSFNRYFFYIFEFTKFQSVYEDPLYSSSCQIFLGI